MQLLRPPGELRFCGRSLCDAGLTGADAAESPDVSLQAHRISCLSFCNAVG